MDKIKNISLIEFLVVLLTAFFIFATIDIYKKMKIHQQYDMEGVLKEIQKKYPKSELTFQNIMVEGNYLIKNKIPSVYSTRDDSYYITNYYRIENDKLIKETNYLFLLHFFVPMILIVTLNDKFSLIKVSEIHKINTITIIMIMVYFIFFAITFFNSNESHTLNIEGINVLKYRK